MSLRKKNIALKSLFDSIRSQNIKALRKEIERGVDVNTLFEEYTPLGYAVECGDTSAVTVLLRAGADVNHGGVVNPLHEAVQAKQIAIIESLLKAGAEVNQAIEHETTPLMMAVFSGSVKAVQMLLDAGADPDLLNNDLQNACEIALENHKHEISLLLARASNSVVKEKNKPPPSGMLLFEAAQKGDIEKLLQIVVSGIDVNTIASKNVLTALAEASGKGHLPTVEALLKLGASPNVDRCCLPLAQASIFGHSAIVQVLLESNADVNMLCTDGESALMHAVQDSHLEVTKILLDAGADVNAMGKIGKTPLSQAYDYEWRYRKRNPAVDLLLNCGATELGEYKKTYCNWKRPGDEGK